MNLVTDSLLEKANEAAIYTLYSYLAHITQPAKNATLQTVIANLAWDFKKGNSYVWTARDLYRFRLLESAVEHHPFLATSKIGNLTVSRNGLTACSLTNQDGKIFVVFRGTGKGEWIDNGEGLSGIPEENTYITYHRHGKVADVKYVENDYATDQQVEALNWFNRTIARNSWGSHTPLTVSGHSKGGNKAQFITIHSNLVDECYSFDGQGFSPEALESFKGQYGTTFEKRRQKVYSFSADNDYINVLGERLVPQNHIYYFESQKGFHYLEAMLDVDGNIHQQAEQGELSRYVETISEKLMRMDPFIRKYATLGIMNIFQKFLGRGVPVNDDKVSIEQTIVGMKIAVDLLLNRP